MPGVIEKAFPIGWSIISGSICAAPKNTCVKNGRLACGFYGFQKLQILLAINRKSTDAVRYMVMRGLIDEEALREYLNKSAATGRVEITALLLESLKNSKDSNGLSTDPFA